MKPSSLSCYINSSLHNLRHWSDIPKATMGDKFFPVYHIFFFSCYLTCALYSLTVKAGFNQSDCNCDAGTPNTPSVPGTGVATPSYGSSPPVTDAPNPSVPSPPSSPDYSFPPPSSGGSSVPSAPAVPIMPPGGSAGGVGGGRGPFVPSAPDVRLTPPTPGTPDYSVPSPINLAPPGSSVPSTPDVSQPPPASSGGGSSVPSTPDVSLSPPSVPEYSVPAPPAGESVPHVPSDPDNSPPHGLTPFPYTEPPTSDPDSGIGTCTFWGTHPSLLPDLLSILGRISDIFGFLPGQTRAFGGDMSLHEALTNTRSDGYGSLLREGSAALVNSMVNGRFAFGTAEVKSLLKAALRSNHAAAVQAGKFRAANEGRLRRTR